MPKDSNIVPMFGEATEGLSPVVTSQKRFNVYVEHPRDAEKGAVALYPRPGLEYVGSATAVGGYPVVRGMRESFPVTTPLSGDTEYGIIFCGFGVVTIDPAGTVGGAAGFLNTDIGPVESDVNPTQLMAVDGAFGYSFQTSPFTFTRTIISAGWFPPGATSVCFLASRFICEKPGTGEFYWSALNDAT